MESAGDELEERLRRCPATADLVVSGEVDCRNLSDGTTVDKLSARLVTGFYLSPIPSASRDELFALLVEVASAVLDEATADMRRELGLGVPSNDLVDALFAEMYAGVGAPRLGAKAFVAEALRRVEVVAKEALGLHAGGQIRSTAVLVMAAQLGALPGLATDELERLSDEVLDTYSRAFHSLDLCDRQLLIGRFMDHCSDVEVAAELKLPLADVDVTCEQALARFMARKDALLNELPEGHS